MPPTTALETIVLSEWVTLREAATLLGISRQGVGQLALRRGWLRVRLDATVLLSRGTVERYARERKRPRGPRRTPALA